jgi:mRNA-degrading endonuclease toxin of MazEF toxin-antitoxin module
VPFQPLRGQVYKANLNPLEGVDAGREHKGDWKPVLVIQADKFSRVLKATTIVVPLSTTLKLAELPSCVLIDKVPGNILTEQCVAICHQVRALDVGKLREFCGQLPASVIKTVAEKVKEVLAI